MLYVYYTSIKLDKQIIRRKKRALSVFHKYTLLKIHLKIVFHKINGTLVVVYFMNNIWWVLNPSGVDLKGKC